VSVVATAGGVPTRLGKYEVLFSLATGGMAHIYIGRSTGIGAFERHVVLKIILPEKANDAVAINMFLDEARLASSLNHQNVAQVFDVGEDAGIHFLAMEFVHGQDLRSVLATAGSNGTRIPYELGLAIVGGAAAGLHHAHERRGPNGQGLGIVHRDVSPSNIMIGYDGSVKVLDFGIAKAAQRSAETVSGVIKGKFAYMSPEQCRGRDVDRRSDVFALGIILYEITTQHRCFRAESDFDTMHRIVTGDVVLPTRLISDYPLGLQAIVCKALAVDQTQRYQTAGALLEAIEQFSASSQISMSTMSLGRFMRHNFGDVQEPWLAPMRDRNQIVSAAYPKESTVSNTNDSKSGMGLATVRLQASSPNSQPLPPQVPTVALTAVDYQDDSADDDEAWNAKSFPTMQPNFMAVENLPSNLRPYASVVNAAKPAPVPSGPQSMTMVSVASDGSPNKVADSGSVGRAPQAPSQPAFMPAAPPTFPVRASSPMVGPGVPQRRDSTAPPMPNVVQQPYLSPGWPADSSGLSSPQFAGYPDARTGSAMSHLGSVTSSRRWIWIVAGLGALTVIVIIAAVIGGGGDGTDKPIDDKPVNVNIPDAFSVETPSDSSMALVVDMAVPDAPKALIEDARIAAADTRVWIHIETTPSGATVVLDGKQLGTTPYEGTVAAKAKGQLQLRKDNYQVTTAIISLDQLLEKSFTLKKLPEKKALPCIPAAAVNIYKADEVARQCK
jgi:eukaryotic-like serine/threonine-protein kinase